MRAKYVLSEVFLGLWRNVTMTIAMIITMAVSLALLGAGVLMYWKVQDMRTFFYGSVEVSIFLKPDVTDQQRTDLKNQLSQDPLVKQADYEDQNTAYKRFKEQFKDAKDLVNSVKPDSLPASFRVKLKDPQKFTQIALAYQNKPGVDSIVDQQQTLDKIFNILGAVQNLALIIAIVQGLAALMLVANTIQVAAYSRRREVSIMKLVGASNWFIQLPFVLEAVFAGIIGSIIAFMVLAAGKVFLVDGSLRSLFIQNVITTITWHDILLTLPLLVGIAAVVSAVTGWITLRFRIRT
jgi:cell division transport system permease protein